MATVRNKGAFPPPNSAKINLQWVKEGIPEQQYEHKERRDAVFNGTKREFDVWVELNHSGRHHGRNQPNYGGAAVTHEGPRLFSEIVKKECQNSHAK